MLRNGARMRARKVEHHENVNPFDSDSANTDDMKLMDMDEHKRQAAVTKKSRKKRSKKDAPVETQSSTEANAEPVGKKKKTSKRSKGKEVGAGEGGERRIIRARRKLQHQENVSDNQLPVENVEQKQTTPMTRLKFSKASEKIDAESKENDEYLTASDFSTVMSPSPIRRSVRLKSPREYDLSVLTEYNDNVTLMPEQNDNITDMYEALLPNSMDDFNLTTDNVLKVKTPSPQKKHTAKKGDETKKRDTYEIKVPVVTPEQTTKRRNTYEIDPQDSFLLSSKKPTVNLEKSDHSKPSPMIRRTMNAPTSIQKRKLFNVSLRNDKMKIKISDSKSSLTESGISSASTMFRRSQRMNPHSEIGTPEANKVKVRSPKVSVQKKTPDLRSNSKVRKVPNYAVIHKNAYDKMEGLDEHLQRKSERAKALLSGNKVSVGSKRPTKDTTTKKQLTFGAAGDAAEAIIESPKPKPIKKSVGFELNTPVRSPLKRHAKTPKPSKEQIWKAYGSKIPKATLFTTGTASAGAAAPVKKIALPAIKTVLPAKKELLLKQIKSVSTRSKASSTTVDSRRNHIRGVRSNRRFDLLMSMRQQTG